MRAKLLRSWLRHSLLTETKELRDDPREDGRSGFEPVVKMAERLRSPPMPVGFAGWALTANFDLYCALAPHVISRPFTHYPAKTM